MAVVAAGPVDLVALATEMASQLADVIFERLGSVTIAGAGGSIVRAYVPIASLESMKDLIVTIIPHHEDFKRAARTIWQHEPSLEIGIQKRIEDEVADVDTLMGLEQDMAEWLKTFVSTTTTAKIKDVKLHTPYSEEHLDEEKVFTGVLLATFELQR